MSMVNYLIAASSSRASRIQPEFVMEGKLILRAHLRELAKTNTSALNQVTIVRALPLKRNPQSDFYWDVSEEIKNIQCKVEFLDVEDKYFSYSSWIQAVQKLQNQFDYYIMVEDDYYPSLYNFVDELVRIHTEKLPNGGYLCSYVNDHAAISNGIGDAKTMIENMNKAIPDPCTCISSAAQTLFGKVCFNNQLQDYTSYYRSLFWSGKLGDYSHDAMLKHTVDIFRPIEYTVLGEDIAGQIVGDFLL